MNRDRIAVFGSAFNPPHKGHEDVINQTLETFDRVILVPSYRHAFGKTMMPFGFRCSLVDAFIKEMDNSKVQYSQVEREIAQQKAQSEPVYTFDVLQRLEDELGTDQLTFVVGPDNADPGTWKKFYNAGEISARWNIWAARERIHVRSSDIRRILAQGKRPNQSQCHPSVSALLLQTI